MSTAGEQVLAAADGSELRYRRWASAGDPVRGTIVLFNGIMSHSGWLGPLAEPLAAAGYTVVGADRRGSGANPDGRGDAVSAAVLQDDALAIVDHERTAGAPLILVGWCWGAALATVLAAKLARTEHPAAGLVLVTPGLFNRPALHEAVEAQRELIGSAAEDAAVVRSPIPEEMFTRGPALNEFIRADSMRLQTFTPRMLTVTGKLVTAARVRLKTLTLPILAVFAADDEATDNEATAAFLDGIVGPLRTASVPGRHGVQFDAPAETTAAISSWLREQVLVKGTAS